MANICKYKVIVKGKKNACYAFYNTMSVSDGIWINDEAGTDEDYTISFEGSCKWSVDQYCNSWKDDFNIVIPENEEEAQAYLNVTVKDRSKLFGVEVLCNSADIEDGRFEIFDHYICGDAVDGECPEELRILEEPEEGFQVCVLCGGEFPEDECVTIDDGETWFCQDCFGENFDGEEDFE